jgi:hypothetical protein
VQLGKAIYRAVEAAHSNGEDDPASQVRERLAYWDSAVIGRRPSTLSGVGQDLQRALSS